MLMPLNWETPWGFCRMVYRSPTLPNGLAQRCGSIKESYFAGLRIDCGQMPICLAVVYYAGTETLENIHPKNDGNGGARRPLSGGGSGV